MTRRVVAIALLFILGPLGVAKAAYLPNERIPTDSSVYRDLERLATRYGTAPRFLSTRPLRRAEALAYLRALAASEPEAESDPALRRALRELDVEAPGATNPAVSASGEDDERVELSPYASLLYSDDPQNRPDINRDYRVGLVMAAQLDTSSILLADLYEGTASQGGRGTPDFGDFNSLVDFNSWLSEAYLEVPVSKIRFLFGHTWLRWGAGWSGTLALSDAAPALDMLRAEAALFGAFRYQQFVSLLDPGPETYLAGHRLEWRARPNLSAGLTEMARFDGTSQALLYMVPFVPYSFWEKRPKSAPGGSVPGDTALTKNNVLWSADASWVVRPGWRLYGEFLLDDYSFSSDYKPDMIGYQIGVDGRRRLGDGRFLTGISEYTRIHNFVYSAWHGHHFEFEGFPLGYVQGPDVQAWSGELALEWGPDWILGARGEWRRKGEGEVGDPWLKEEGEVDASVFQGVVERETRLAGFVTYSPARWLRLQGTVGAAEIENQDHLPSAATRKTPFLLSARLFW